MSSSAVLVRVAPTFEPELLREVTHSSDGTVADAVAAAARAEKPEDEEAAAAIGGETSGRFGVWQRSTDGVDSPVERHARLGDIAKREELLDQDGKPKQDEAGYPIQVLIAHLVVLAPSRLGR